MNFLLHHHLASAELGSGVEGVGAMLPDIWRMADRRVRARRIEHVETANAQLDGLMRGVDHHLDADRWFHETRPFRDGERRTAELLRMPPSEGASSRRLPLFAHVLWEMCLDGALLRRQGFAGKRAELRRDITEALSTPALRTSATLHHFAHRPVADRVPFDLRVERLALQIADGEWIEGYQDAEGLALRLAGVRSRLGFSPPSDAERQAWARAIEPLIVDADGALEELLEERRCGTDAPGLLTPR